MELEIKNMRLFISDVVKRQKAIYFLSRDYNLIFSVTKDGKTVPEISIPDIPANQRCADSMVMVSDAIYIAPMDVGYIWKYFPDEKKLNKVDYEVEGRLVAEEGNIYGNYLYFTGITAPYIVKLNVVTNRCEFLRQPYERLSGLAPRNYDNRFIQRHSIRSENHMYFLSARDNGILDYKVIDDSFKWSYVGGGVDIFCGFTKRKDETWFLNKENEIIKRNGTSGKVSRMKIKDNSGNIARYSSPVTIGDDIWFINLSEKDSNLRIGRDGHIDRTDKSRIYIKAFDDGSYITQLKDGRVIYTDNGEDIEIKCEISSDELKDFFMNQNNKTTACFNEILREDAVIGLEYFIRNI